MGTTASGKGVWAEKGYVPGKDRGGGLMGWGQWARGVWVGSAHLDICNLSYPSGQRYTTEIWLPKVHRQEQSRHILTKGAALALERHLCSSLHR